MRRNFVEICRKFVKKSAIHRHTFFGGNGNVSAKTAPFPSEVGRAHYSRAFFR